MQCRKNVEKLQQRAKSWEIFNGKKEKRKIQMMKGEGEGGVKSGGW